MPERGDLVTFVNRAPVPLEFVFNGKTRILKPGDNPNLPWEWARFAKNQHPVMGEENPHSLVGATLIVIKEEAEAKDPDSLQPLTKVQWNKHLKSVERWNRGKYGSPIWGEQAKPARVVKRGKSRPESVRTPMGGEVNFGGAG